VVFDWAGPQARLVGTVVHALLQRIAQESLDAWDGRALRGKRDTVQRLLIRSGLVGQELEAATNRVLKALGQALADPRGRWVLGPQGEARTEWELTMRVDGRPRRIAPDRTFVAADGARWIVDYKTGSHAGGSLDEFLDRERERYQPQLERYARALRMVDPQRPIRCGLYFPLAQAADGTGGWREWEYFPLP
jgi:ATP-dependent exoDNAse (exonuclease V) beta subunit